MRYCSQELEMSITCTPNLFLLMCFTDLLECSHFAMTASPTFSLSLSLFARLSACNNSRTAKQIL
jgi:hypothetical protein